jgi:tetrathionate reductase subunit B
MRRNSRRRRGLRAGSRTEGAERATARKTFLVDVNRCTGCGLCVVACKDEHVGNAHRPWTAPQPATGHFWIDVRSIESGRIPRVRVSHLPLLCQHCENAACMKVCPEDAIRRRDDGLVWIDPAACSGCGLCREACPYGVIHMNDALKVAQKCHGCAHRVDEGLDPRCADVCPHEAIVFGDEDSEAFAAAAGDGPLEVYHPEYQPRPRVYWRGLPKPHIAGEVVDAESDEVVAGAVVTATDLFDDGSFTALTDGFGEFRIGNLGSDRRYRLAVRKEGYRESALVVATDGARDVGTIRLARR